VLDPTKIIPYVQTEKLGPGKVHTLRVALDEIEGVTASEVSPKKVTLVRRPEPPPNAGDAGVAAPGSR